MESVNEVKHLNVGNPFQLTGFVWGFFLPCQFLGRISFKGGECNDLEFQSFEFGIFNRF